MRAASGFWRRVTWTDHARGDRLTIGFVVCAPGGGFAWGVRPDLASVGGFGGVPVADLLAGFLAVVRFLADADDLTRYACPTPQADGVGLGEPLYASCHDQEGCEAHRDGLLAVFARRREGEGR